MDIKSNKKLILFVALISMFYNNDSYAETAKNSSLSFKTTYKAPHNDKASGLICVTNQHADILRYISPGGRISRDKNECLLVKFNGHDLRLGNSFFQHSPPGFIFSNYDQNHQAIYMTVDSLTPRGTDELVSDPCYLIRVGLNGESSSYYLNAIPYPEKSSKFLNPDDASGFIVDPVYIKQSLATAKKCESKPFSLRKNDILVTGTFSTNDSDHMKKAKTIYGDDPFIGDDKGIVFNSLFVTWVKENRTVEIPFKVFAGVHDTFETCDNPGGFILEIPDEDTVVISDLLHSYVYDPIRFVVIVNKNRPVESAFIGMSHWNQLKVERGGRNEARKIYENNSKFYFEDIKQQEKQKKPARKPISK